MDMRSRPPVHRRWQDEVETAQLRTQQAAKRLIAALDEPDVRAAIRQGDAAHGHAFQDNLYMPLRQRKVVDTVIRESNPEGRELLEKLAEGKPVAKQEVTSLLHTLRLVLREEEQVILPQLTGDYTRRSGATPGTPNFWIANEALYTPKELKELEPKLNKVNRLEAIRHDAAIILGNVKGWANER